MIKTLEQIIAEEKAKLREMLRDDDKDLREVEMQRERVAQIEEARYA